MKPIARLQWSPPVEGDCGRAAVEVLDKSKFPAGFAALVRVMGTAAGDGCTYGCRLDVGDAGWSGRPSLLLDESEDQNGPVDSAAAAVDAGLNCMAFRCVEVANEQPQTFNGMRLLRMAASLLRTTTVVDDDGIGSPIEICDVPAAETPGGTPSVPQLSAEQLAEARAYETPADTARPDATDEPSRSAEEYPEPAAVPVKRGRGRPRKVAPPAAGPAIGTVEAPAAPAPVPAGELAAKAARLDRAAAAMIRERELRAAYAVAKNNRDQMRLDMDALDERIKSLGARIDAAAAEHAAAVLGTAVALPDASEKGNQ